MTGHSANGQQHLRRVIKKVPFSVSVLRLGHNSSMACQALKQMPVGV